MERDIEIKRTAYAVRKMPDTQQEPTGHFSSALFSVSKDFDPMNRPPSLDDVSQYLVVIQAKTARIIPRKFVAFGDLVGWTRYWKDVLSMAVEEMRDSRNERKKLRHEIPEIYARQLRLGEVPHYWDNDRKKWVWDSLPKNLSNHYSSKK